MRRFGDRRSISHDATQESKKGKKPKHMRLKKQTFERGLKTMKNTIIEIVKSLHTNNDTTFNKDGWTALFEALSEAQSDREMLEIAEDEAESAWLQRTKEADYDEEVNDADYNLSVRASNAYRKAEAARRVEAILVKAVEDIYKAGYVEIEEEA